MSSADRRVFPTPGSPASVTIDPDPLAARPRAESSSRLSALRP